jgi:divalent metal cation (Fe/Co/Zn/Cd) transporter
MTSPDLAPRIPARDLEPAPVERDALVRRGVWLEWFTIAWNSVEGIAGIVAGIAAGSIALVGFGIDSYVEVFAGSVIVWRLAQDRHGHELSRAAERRAVRLIAATFLVLAAGVGIESVRRLANGAEADDSLFGIGLALVSLVAMPLLARAKRRVGEKIGSRAVTADATETTLCVWLSAILVAGLGLNTVFGWWWADPLAGLAIVYVAAREGIEHGRTDELDGCC